MKRAPVRAAITPKAIEAYRICLETGEANDRCSDRSHGHEPGGDGQCLPGCREHLEALQTLRLELGVKPWEDGRPLFRDTEPDYYAAGGDWPERARGLREQLKEALKEGV